jgi:hypothetical protein
MRDGPLDTCGRCFHYRAEHNSDDNDVCPNGQGYFEPLHPVEGLSRRSYRVDDLPDEWIDAIKK